jgi:hypothetical protein
MREQAASDEPVAAAISFGRSTYAGRATNSASLAAMSSLAAATLNKNA